MKAIVTGGAGFIGSHLSDALVDLNYETVVIDNLSVGRYQNIDHLIENSNFTFVEADICNFDLIEPLFEDADCVFHLAALADIVPSIDNPTQYFNSNVDGTFNILQACRKHQVKKIIYAGSSSCYGIPDEYPTKETAAIRPQYPYALTKNIGEQLVMHWCQLYSLPAISLRFFNVYGPRARTSGTYGAVFGVFLAQKLANKPYTVVGDGNQTRDFTYVSDVVDAIIKVSKRKNLTGEIFNVGSGKTVSVNKITKLLRGSTVNIPKRPGEPDITFASIRKIFLKTGWKPKISIEQGIKNILVHIEDWKHAPVWTPSKISQKTKKWFYYLGK